MKDNIKLSVVILNHNDRSNTFNCIKYLYKSKTNFTFHIIVVDNGNERGVEEQVKKKFKNIIYFKSNNNGYGAGNNIGIKHAIGNYVLILNPDCRVKTNTLQVLSEFLDNNKNAGAVSPNILDKNGNIFLKMGSRELTPIRAIFSLSILNNIFPKNRISKEYYLYDKSLNKIRETDVIPGSAFMIKRDVFIKAGGFDEKIFLYFEESDLGKRVRKLGYKFFITPDTEVVHKWKDDKSNRILKKYFDKSRFYYFKKHYGMLNALLVDLFCRISIYNIVLLIVFIFGIFLRFYKANKLFILDSEIADNLINIKNSYLNAQLPLIGPPTSHPWLYFGPLFYWLYGPILIIFRFEPISHLYFGLIVNSLTIVINYLVVKRYWNYTTTLLSTYFVCVSPYLLGFSNNTRFYTYTVILSLFTLYLVQEVLNNKTYLFWLFLSIGILLNFHYSAIVLIPAIFLILYINKIKLNMNEYFKIVLGIFIPLFPLFLYDLQHKLSMTKNIIIWFPYRILSVLNIIPNKNIPKGAFLQGMKNLIIFIGYLFSNPNLQIICMLGLITTMLLIILFIKKYLKIDKYTKNIFILTTISALILVFHGDTPNHYFLVISAYSMIFISSIITNYLHKILKIVIITIFIFISILNIFYYFDIKNKSIKYQNYPNIYYFNIKKIADFIYKDSNSNPIAIARIGDNDDFGGNFAQNYQYILWRDGNEPVRVGNLIISNNQPKYLYTIIENNYEYKNYKYIYKTEIGGVTIYKSSYEK